ncbi:DNA polymerase Y family protein [Xanthomonas vasicola]|nr:DNA polymerase Y family protein [Xanthomonas vasicola]
MLWACIVLPQLALDAVLRRLEEPQAPLVLVEGPAQLRSLHSVNAAAGAAGLKAGMRLSAAHALMTQVRTIDYDAHNEARTQRFLAAWAYRHSSLVSQQWSHAIVLEAGLRDGMVVTQLPALHSTLDKVPVRRAALPDDAGERLQHMGVRTLAAVRALPRDGIRRRFGAGLLDHLDRLYGQVDDPLECYAPPDHFDHRVELGYEVETHPALLFPLRRLIGDLCTYLSIRDGGVQRFLLRLEHEEGATDVEIGLLTPERAPTLLFELARNRLERVEIPRPVVAMRLLARQLPPFVPAMCDLFDQRAQQSVEWPQLRERLRARLGDDAVYRVLPADDPRPERAWRRAIGDAVREAAAPPRPPRPTWLLPQPVPLHDPHLRIVSGPERLESGWWDDDEARRDYYVVETARGRRGWAFAAPGRVDGWMLHGWFA